MYWAARDRTDNGTNDWALRMYLTKTRDFVTFTEPEIWTSLNEKGDGLTGPNIIDSTIAKEGDTYYRFSTSDWMTVVDTAPSLDGPWTREIDRGEAAAHGLRSSMEGLTVYQLPDERWAVMGDQSGYYGHTADTLASLQFQQLSAGPGANQYSFAQPFRHGSVLRLSAAEEETLLRPTATRPWIRKSPRSRSRSPSPSTPSTTARSPTPPATRTSRRAGPPPSRPTRSRARPSSSTAPTNGFASFPTGFFDGRSTMTVSMDVKSEKSQRQLLHLRPRRRHEQVLLPAPARRRRAQRDHPDLVAERVRGDRFGGQRAVAPRSTSSSRARP